MRNSSSRVSNTRCPTVHDKQCATYCMSTEQYNALAVMFFVHTRVYLVRSPTGWSFRPAPLSIHDTDWHRCWRWVRGYGCVCGSTWSSKIILIQWHQERKYSPIYEKATHRSMACFYVPYDLNGSNATCETNDPWPCPRATMSCSSYDQIVT